jgi:hypothetical protein
LEDAISKAIDLSAEPRRHFNAPHVRSNVVEPPQTSRLNEAAQDSWQQRGSRGVTVPQGSRKWGSIVPLSNMRYTHNSIAPAFGDGKTLSALVADLHSGKVHPLKEHPSCNFLILHAIKIESTGESISLNNRRLRCLNMYAKEAKAKVYLRVKFKGTFEDKQVYLKFMKSNTSTTGGKTIEIRKRQSYLKLSQHGW